VAGRTQPHQHPKLAVQVEQVAVAMGKVIPVQSAMELLIQAVVAGADQLLIHQHIMSVAQAVQAS
jgi:hypothetical protein